MHTVALFNHNGNLGSKLFLSLLPYHTNGTVKLVILHRPGSSLDSIPKDASIETRAIEVDSPEGHAEENKRAVQGLNIVISAASIPGNLGQIPLIQALIGSPDIWAYIPSHFGPRYTATEVLENPHMAFLFQREHMNIMARENGVPVCDVKADLWVDIFFAKTYMMYENRSRSIDVIKNTIKGMDGFESSPLPLSTIAFIAEGITELVVNQPKEIGDKAYDLVEFQPTGAELISILTKVHRAPPTVEKYTFEQYKTDLEGDLFKKIFAIVANKWATNNWRWAGENFRPSAWDGKPLEALINDAKVAFTL